MPRPKKDARMTYQTVVRLPDEVVDDFVRIAHERGVPPAVLARMWILEKLREEQRAAARRDAGE